LFTDAIAANQLIKVDVVGRPIGEGDIQTRVGEAERIAAPTPTLFSSGTSTPLYVR
jgi:hypothetical protein